MKTALLSSRFSAIKNFTVWFITAILSKYFPFVIWIKYTDDVSVLRLKIESRINGRIAHEVYAMPRETVRWDFPHLKGSVFHCFTWIVSIPGYALVPFVERVMLKDCFSKNSKYIFFTHAWKEHYFNNLLQD